ncbi:hypothetical protein [Streptosporangium minutum]|uniref:hypothetical protein n=1 Tax=Streptosporangium minutum TaxID=569862 RepID=UPI00105544A0|nr:hypothetical protein [Streptosporangium minutum]
MRTINETVSPTITTTAIIAIMTILLLMMVLAASMVPSGFRLMCDPVLFQLPLGLRTYGDNGRNGHLMLIPNTDFSSHVTPLSVP